MGIKPAINQFNGGEISPWLEGRFDWDKYNYSSKLCKNFIPLIEGSLKRRSGSHFVAKTEELPVINKKFSITFSNNPAALPKTYISIDGGDEEELPSFFSPIPYQINANYGDVFEYAIRAEGYQPAHGTVQVINDDVIHIELLSIENAVTLTINPDPENADVYINNIKTRSLTFDKSQTVSYLVVFGLDKKRASISINEDTTINVVLNRIIFDNTIPYPTYATLQHGFYKVIVIGGGGSAAGGSWGDDHKSTGGGGGSGAGFSGVVELSGDYLIKRGYGATGGNADRRDGYQGGSGGDSQIGSAIIAGGGKFGRSRLPSGGDGGTGNQGMGGVIEVNVTPVQTDFKKNGDGGRVKTASGGTSVYNGYGQGGSGVYKNRGGDGSVGYVYIEYIGSSYNG